MYLYIHNYIHAYILAQRLHIYSKMHMEQGVKFSPLLQFSKAVQRREKYSAHSGNCVRKKKYANSFQDNLGVNELSRKFARA